MDDSVASMLELIVLLVWNAITQSVQKNIYFEKIFFSTDIVSEVVREAGLFFCPSLLDAILSENPPDISFFKNLPAVVDNKWAVYCLVMEKFGHRPRVYCGSATNSRDGLHGRWRIYNDVKTYYKDLPVYVRKALDEGFDIVHKGTLLWSPRSTQADSPRIRLLLIAIEAVMSFLFWTMHAKTKDYGIGGCCLWSREDISYDGLCGHNALNEGVNGNFDLSTEELEAMALEAKARRKTYLANWHKQKRAEDLPAYLAKQRAQHAAYRAKNSEAITAYSKKWRANVVEEKRFYCDLCNRAMFSQYALERHNNSTRHKKKVAEAKKGITKKFSCKPCGFTCNTRSDLTAHNGGKRHLERMAKEAAKPANKTTSISTYFTSQSQ